MTTGPSHRSRRPPRRRRLLRLLVGMTALVVVFGAGLALGEALQDKPGPARTQTLVRTLRPLQVPPTPETVTVTVRR